MPAPMTTASKCSSASHRRQVPHVEDALEDPVVQPRLAQLVAVEDRPRALPALLQEVQQRAVGLLAGHPVQAVQDPGRAVDAEAALARAHAQAQLAADVVEVVRAAAAHGLLEPAARDHLALADELVLAQPFLLAGQPVAELVGLAVLGAGQRLGGGRAGARLAELAADRVDRVLGHEPVGRELAAGHRHEALDAVALRVVEQRVGARDVARVGVGGLGVLEERAHAGPDAQRPRLLEAGHEALALLEHRVDLVLVDRVVVGVLGVDVGRADDADGADRDDDVAVGGHRAAVDDRVHQPVVHRDHDPPAREDADALDAGHLRDAPGPRAGSVDRDARLDVGLLAGALVAQARARDLVAVAVDGDRPVIGEHAGAALLRAARHRPDQLPHLDVAIGHAEDARDPRVQARLLAQRLRRIDLLARHAGRPAALGEAIRVRGVVERGGDEEAAGVLDAVGGDLAHDHVLGDALLRRVRVLDRVAPARVQQPVEAPARALGQVGAVGEDDVEAAQGGVPRHAGAGGAAADDEDVGAEDRHSPARMRLERSAWWRPSMRRIAPDFERIESDCVSTRCGV